MAIWDPLWTRQPVKIRDAPRPTQDRPRVRGDGNVTLWSDGACSPNPGPGSFAVVVRDRDGRLLCRLRKDLDRVTCNEAEWRGALAALDWLLVHQPQFAELRMDSRLVVQQLLSRWRARAGNLQALVMEGQRRLVRLADAGVKVRVEWVRREQNSEADAHAARRRHARMERVELWGH